jgi:hypothetical protein
MITLTSILFQQDLNMHLLAWKLGKDKFGRTQSLNFEKISLFQDRDVMGENNCGGKAKEKNHDLGRRM